VVPLRKPYEWNQGLMDIGATLCRPREPLCLVCPLRDQCGGPRPLARNRKTQGAFHESNRYHRGRILDALLAEPRGLPVSQLREDLVRAMVRDGLIEVDQDGRARLPA
jgi:A/G-specific adenine glycosylase